MEPFDYVTGYRFEGFNTLMLASETEWAREGVGPRSMLDAHDALRAIGSAMAGADDALHGELSRLGVVWESESGRAAAHRVGDSAEFAETAAVQVDRAAQGVWMIGQAFTSLLHNLPDAQTLRDGADGLSVGDMLAGLIGHETDHAAAVRASAAGRDQAIDALNGFQETAVTELSAITALPEPPGFVAGTRSGAPSDRPAVPPISAIPGAPAPVDCAPRSFGGVVPAAQDVEGGGGSEGPAPTAPEAPAARGAAPVDCEPGDLPGTGSQPPQERATGEEPWDTGGSTDRRDTVDKPVATASESPEASADQRTSSGVAPPRPVAVPPAPDLTADAVPDAASSRTDTLAKGNVTGVVTPPPTSPPELASAVYASPPAPRGDDAVGAGAAALLAAGIAGAVSGEKDRGRGVRGLTKEDLADDAQAPDEAVLEADADPDDD